MHSYAQTNLQLFTQLRRDGYSNTELGCIFNAYKLVICLFTGCFRPSGKTFIAHLVGTASILSYLHVPASVVAAGLLHAAYANGDFGDGKTGISDARREQVRRTVGHQVEEYVSRYTALQWNEQTIPAICDHFGALGQIDRSVLLIRLANELEEYLDLGILYCEEARYQEYINSSRHLMVGMAEKLGFPALTIELLRVFSETALAKIPLELRNQSGQNSSFVLAPNSYQKRLKVAFYHWLVNGLRHLRSAISVRTKLHFRS